MKLHSFLLVALALLCVCASSAFATCAPSQQSWSQPLGNDLSTASVSDACTTNLNLTNNNVSGYTLRNISTGTWTFNPLIINLDKSQNTLQTVLVKGNTVYIYSANGTNLILLASKTLDSTIVSSPVTFEYTQTNKIALVVMTGTRVEFLSYNASEQTLGRYYIEQANDYYLPYGEYIYAPQIIKCVDHSNNDPYPMCALAGYKPGTFTRSFLVFSPRMLDNNGSNYYPQFKVFNTTVTDPWASARYESTASNADTFQFATTNDHDTFDGDPTTAQYDLFYTDSYGTKVFRTRVDIDWNGVITGFSNVAGWSSSGIDVPRTVDSPSFDQSSTRGDLTTSVMDFQADGIPEFCMNKLDAEYFSYGHASGLYTGYQWYFLNCYGDDGTLYNTSHIMVGMEHAATGYGSVLSNSVIFTRANDAYPTLCQKASAVTSITVTTANPYKSYMICSQWDGTQMVASSYLDKLTVTSARSYYSGSTLVAFKPFANPDQYYLLYANILFNATSNVANPIDNTAFSDTRFTQAKLAVGNAAYGDDLEIVATHASGNSSIVSVNLAQFTLPQVNYTPPTWNPQVSTYISDYYSKPCANSVQNYSADWCSSTNTSSCSYIASSNTMTRLVSDCGIGVLTYGAYSYTKPTVSCTMPATEQPLTITFYIQEVGATSDFSRSTSVDLMIRSTECSLADDYIDTYAPVIEQNNSAVGGSTAVGEASAANTPQAFFDMILGDGQTSWKLGMAFLFIVVGMVIVGNTEMVKSMRSGQSMVIGACGFILFILFTFMGLIPAWIFIAMTIFIVGSTIAWRVFFPSAAQ